MFERNLSAFPFSNFINFLFQPFRFVCKSDVRQIFVGLNLIVREIYVLSFEIVVLCVHLVLVFCFPGWVSNRTTAFYTSFIKIPFCWFLFSITIFNHSIFMFPIIWHYHIIPVYSHSLLTRFAPFAAIAGPFLRRLRLTPLSWLTGNEWHNQKPVS